MKAFSITGWSGSGKTTLITRIIRRLSENKRKVAAVKRVPEKYHLQPESKDTAKFLEAGAQEVCLCAKGEIMHMNRLPENADVLGMLLSKYADCDILLLEGLQNEKIPMIEVFDPALETAMKFSYEELCAVVCDEPLNAPVPLFKRDDVEALCRFMEVYNG